MDSSKVAAKASKMQQILEALVAGHDGVIALSLHDIASQEEVAWAGPRTELSEEIGVAVTERMAGAAVRRICDGFEAIGKGAWTVTRDEFTLERQEDGRKLDHVAVRVSPDSRFVVSALFRPGLSSGLRKVVENAAIEELRQELAAGSRSDMRVPPR